LKEVNPINDDLLVKYLLEEATAEERKEVEERLAADVSYQKYYNHLKLIWEQSRQLAVTTTVNEEDAWQRLQQRIISSGEAPIKQMPKVPWKSIAALFVLVAGAAIITYNWTKVKPVKNEIVYSKNEVVKDTLPDGSFVTLNKNSQVSYPQQFKGDRRTISLQGEAFFNVTPDKAKPFIIYVNDVTVQVVGTSFNIRSNNGTTEVIVESGIVKVSRQNKTTELKEGEKVSVNKSDTAVTKDAVTDKLYNYYRTKEFVCDNTPLWKLVEALNEAYNANIVIERKELKSLPLTVTFYNEPLDQVLSIIEETLNITATKSGNGLILR
jgi:ferric-dicitrate binding protein FerR (iron transport regulator)